SSKKVEEVKEGSSKRAATKLEQESYKKYKVEDDKDAAKLKQLVNIIPDEEGVAIDVIPLAVKPPSNADWKIHKKGKKTYYQIIKADGSLKIYLIFCHMLKDFDKEDVETLWKLVKAKYGSTRPERDYDRVLWGNLKVMFEPHVEHEVCKMQQRYKVVRWTLFNSCGVHLLSMQSGHIYMSSKKVEEVKEGSSKRAATKLEQESYKKYKVEDDKDAAKLKQLVNIIPDEEGVAIDVIPLAVKPPSNADWKIHKKGKKTYYQIIKADGSLKIYLIFCHMLKDFDKEDVETLWKLVKAKYVSTRPERDYDRVLWGK
nr:hypothetical protein [Tanacetum cinerariifolium]